MQPPSNIRLFIIFYATEWHNRLSVIDAADLSVCHSVVYDDIYTIQRFFVEEQRNPCLCTSSGTLISLSHVSESERIISESELFSTVGNVSSVPGTVPQPRSEVSDTAR